jgi:hypothetical protein
MKKSPIDFYKLKPFNFKEIKLYNFFILGLDRNISGLVHFAYLHKAPINTSCTVDENFTALSPFCKQFVVRSAGIAIGCLFVCRQQQSRCENLKLEIGKMKSFSNMEIIHFLDEHGLLGFKSLDSSLLIISRHVSSPIVYTLKDEDLQRSL